MTKQKGKSMDQTQFQSQYKATTLVWPQNKCNSQGRYQKLAEMGTEEASPAAKGQECGLSAHIMFVEDVIWGDYLQNSTLWDRSFQPTSQLLKVSSIIIGNTQDERCKQIIRSKEELSETPLAV